MGSEGDKETLLRLYSGNVFNPFNVDIEVGSITLQLGVTQFDEWNNFLERIGRDVSTGDVDLHESSSDSLELRFWASYRGQTLARTVRGMMYYRRALMLPSYVESRPIGVND
ncbi:hypothetical protein K1719_007332 [Acacia pycnantha]|nr:hypothetical protein K1719_007332 [Acacia pycnantha]